MTAVFVYVVTSVVIFLVDVLLFWAALASGIHYLLANAVIFVALSLAQFAMLRQRLYPRTRWWRGFTVFIGVGSLGLLLQNVFLAVGIEVLRAPPLAAKLVAVVVAFLAVYLLRRRMLGANHG